MAKTTRNTVNILARKELNLNPAVPLNSNKDSFLKLKQRRLQRKMYQGKYDTRDKNLPTALANSSNHSRARCHENARKQHVHSKHQVLSLKSNCLEL